MTDATAEFLFGDLPRPGGSGLRAELQLHEAEPERDGSPAWILVDPLAGKFYRLGKLEIDLLRLAPLGDPKRIAAAATLQSGAQISEELVKQFLGFLAQNNLLRVSGEEGRARLSRLAETMGKVNLRKLGQGWMSVRLRLLRPEPLLVAGLPLARWWFGRSALVAAALSAVLGAAVALHQIDAFFATFSFFFSFEGALFYMLTLTVLKALHEFGHAFACKLQGCRVPSMGVTFLVLWPVLYTDTTEAWKLPSRAARLRIGFAGMRTELMLAGFALLLWSLLPDGLLRSVCFFVSTTAAATTLLVNLNPLMKFDGYYLMSDFLRLPNLQERTYALARWWLRKTLFGWMLTPPEAPRLSLIALGAAIWLYRLSVTFGIALLVYHFVFKTLGAILAFGVLWWGVVLPFAKEIKEVAKARPGFNRRSLSSLGIAGLLVLLAIVPWQTSVSLPAFLGAESVTRVYAAADGQVLALHVADAAKVESGQPLMDIDTPDLAYQLSDAERDVEALRWQLSSQGLDSKLLDRSMVTAAELRTSLSKRDSLRDRMRKAQPLAPFAGAVVDLPDNLHAGDWVGEGTYLASVVSLKPEDLVAYADESQLHRIKADAKGRLYLKGQGEAVAVRLAMIETGALRELDQPFMASNHGGEIAVREAAEGKLVPVRAIYRIRFKIDGEMAQIRHVSLGTVRLEALPESFVQAAWRRVIGVIRRELSF